MLKQFLGESWNLAVPFSSNLNESQFVATIAEKPVMDSFEKHWYSLGISNTLFAIRHDILETSFQLIHLTENLRIKKCDILRLQQARSGL
jgi:hypothetical protein